MSAQTTRKANKSWQLSTRTALETFNFEKKTFPSGIAVRRKALGYQEGETIPYHDSLMSVEVLVLFFKGSFSFAFYENATSDDQTMKRWINHQEAHRNHTKFKLMSQKPTLMKTIDFHKWNSGKIPDKNYYLTGSSLACDSQAYKLRLEKESALQTFLENFRGSFIFCPIFWDKLISISNIWIKMKVYTVAYCRTLGKTTSREM